MQRLIKLLSAPGKLHEIEAVAPTQVVFDAEISEENNANNSTENINGYTTIIKPKMLERWLDKVVEASGSEFAYFTIIIALLIWAFLGIPFGKYNTWQVIISDAQAIVNMVFDAFLMRQQLNSHDSLLTVAACLRSRSTSNKRMLLQLIGSGKYSDVSGKQFSELEQTTFASELPRENWLGRISTGLSAFMGHILTVLGFWVCVFIWIGFGKYCGWSDTWQLYMNSATSALMVFILAFLANIRERHTKYMTKCLSSIWQLDSALELRLRRLTQDTTENEPVKISPRKRGWIQRRIDYYADLVGTLLGIALLALALVLWLAVGPVPKLHFDTNWWLLIGTYAGLLGLNDGFVLRNVYTVLGEHENAQFTLVEYEDADMLSTIGITTLSEERVPDQSLTCRISTRVGDVCAHQYTVVLGVLLIAALLIGATAMRWSVTGQLLCNVPPSIIESFFTMILITGHNIGDKKRRVDFHNIYLRRLMLVKYVDLLAKVELEAEGEKEEGEEVVGEIFEVEE
jgi:low-affinity ferrous iron transport protein